MVSPSDQGSLHTSVLLEEALGYLEPSDGGVYVDGTLGLGGHSLSLLQKSSPSGRVIAFEWDAAAIEHSRKRLVGYEDRLTIIRRNFAEIVEGLQEAGVGLVDGILIDIGLSSLQLDQGKRGFSFRFDEPLDMRMDLRSEITAESIVALCSEQELADIFFYYGDEKQAKPIAAKIVEVRKSEKIETAKQLASVVARSIPKRFHPKKIHVATKVFQALRIAVNTELENLSKILDEGVSCLKVGGKFCVISFHSLEDRMVKRKFRENKDLKVVTSKPVTPSTNEISSNPRSRSARMRVAVKIG